MRIALVTTEYVTEPNFAGGVSNYTHKVALGLKELGHAPEVFVRSDSSEAFHHDGVRVERCPRAHNLGLKIYNRYQRYLRGNALGHHVWVRSECWGLEKRLRAGLTHE